MRSRTTLEVGDQRRWPAEVLITKVQREQKKQGGPPVEPHGGGGGGGGGDTQTQPTGYGGTIQDGSPPTDSRITWYYWGSSEDWESQSPITWQSLHFYEPGEIITMASFLFARIPDGERKSGEVVDEPDWGSAAVGDVFPDGGGGWERLPDDFLVTALPDWEPSTDYTVTSGGNGIGYVSPGNGAIYVASIEGVSGTEEPIWVNYPCAGWDSFYADPNQGDPDPKYILSRAYIPGSIYAYLNGVHIVNDPPLSITIIETDPAQGSVAVYGGTDDDIIKIHFAAYCT